MKRASNLQLKIVVVGVLSGLAFLLTAVVTGSSVWPFIWPLTGGVALAVATHRAKMGWRRATSIALRAGGIAAVVVVALGIPVAWLAASAQMTDTAEADATGTFATIVGGMLVAAVLCAALELAGALIAHPFAHRPPARV